MDHADLDAAITTAHRRLNRGAWLRCVGYQEEIGGHLDRYRLDQLAPGRAVRVQHRSGKMWVLSTQALNQLDLHDETDDIAERDHEGNLTGRLFRYDAQLRNLEPRIEIDLVDVGRQLNSYGITGVTDMTEGLNIGDIHTISAAVDHGLSLDITVTGNVFLQPTEICQLSLGPVKLVVEDADLPCLDDLCSVFEQARMQQRPIAIHCVTRATLVLVLAAMAISPPLPHSRLEHGSVIPFELLSEIARLGLTIVTQPHFISERGDHYLKTVDACDISDLYPCRRLIEAGIPVAIGSDAPFGHPDPWRMIKAASDRTTSSGQSLCASEAIDTNCALAMFLSRPMDPGGTKRTVAVGEVADLCVLNCSLEQSLAEPTADHVRCTISRGRLVFCRD